MWELDPKEMMKLKDRFNVVSWGYFNRVLEAYSGDTDQITSDTDEQVAANVAAYEIAQGWVPRDWTRIGRYERGEIDINPPNT